MNRRSRTRWAYRPGQTVAGGLLAATAATLAVVVVISGGSRSDAAVPAAVTGLNPVRQPVNGHPANSGFLVYVQHDVSMDANESEGTMALGGDFTPGSSYNVAAGGAPVFPTVTLGDDTTQTYFYVGGGVTWADPNARANVENGGFTKIGDTSTYDAFDTDPNGASVPYRIVSKGQSYDSTPLIQGRTNQSPASIGATDPERLSFDESFAAYRSSADDLASCASTVQLTDVDGNPLHEIPPGTQGYLKLTPGVTNVLQLSPSELDNLSELTFQDQPTKDTPLLVNVTGGQYDGDIPNLAGVSDQQAPYMFWNFPTATDVTVTPGSDTIEGTMFAPNATLNWLSTGNIEGNVIAANFNHGSAGSVANELHDFPFDTTLTCTNQTPTSSTTSPTSSTTSPTSSTTSSTTSPTSSTTSPTSSTTSSTTSPTSSTTGPTSSTTSPTSSTTSPSTTPTSPSTTPTSPTTPPTTEPPTPTPIHTRFPVTG